MTIEKIGEGIARVRSKEPVLTDAGSMLDLMATVRYETLCNKIAIDKSAVAENFFILSTGVAGEILQKCVNYRLKLAIIGNFSAYTSKPLKDFIYESNKGRDFFFVSTEEEAIQRLSP